MRLTDAEKRELREWATDPYYDSFGGKSDKIIALLDEIESLRSINKGLSDKCELLFREDEAREEVTQSAEQAAREYAHGVHALDNCLSEKLRPGTRFAEHLYLHCTCDLYDAFLAGARWGRGRG